jgi:hypothetical protein
MGEIRLMECDVCGTQADPTTEGLLGWMQIILLQGSASAAEQALHTTVYDRMECMTKALAEAEKQAKAEEKAAAKAQAAAEKAAKAAEKEAAKAEANP